MNKINTEKVWIQVGLDTRTIEAIVAKYGSRVLEYFDNYVLIEILQPMTDEELDKLASELRQS